MDQDTYRFRLGGFECIVVSDGYRTYTNPAPLLFANAPHDILRTELRAYGRYLESWETEDLPYLAMVVFTGDRVVLIDTGAGNLATTTGNLMKHLAYEKISAGDVDTVIITHAHPDHIGGLLDLQGKPAFPHARYAFRRAEWEFWTSNDIEETLNLTEPRKSRMIDAVRKYLPPLRENLLLIDGDREIVKGIRCLDAPGHTPGNVTVSISSEGKTLLCISDLVIHPLHCSHPEWYEAVAINPEKTVSNRFEILRHAADEKSLVFASHFPFPGIGTLAEEGDAWKWKPVM